MKNTRPLKVMFTTAALAAALTGCGSDSDSGSGDGGQGGVDNNAAPVISSTVVRSLLENTEYSYTFAATDADADDLVYSATTLPSWLTFDEDTGVLSGTAGEAGNHDVVLSVTDGENVVTESFTITVEVDDGSVFTVFKDSVASGWAVWGEGGQLPVQETDGDATYGEVFVFTNMEGGNFAAGQTVNGFSSDLLKQGGGVAFDASAYRDTGSIQFDLKLTEAPSQTDIWYFKVQSSTAHAGSDSILIDTPVLDTWKHYVVPLNLIKEDNVAELLNLMVFPNWGENEGAVFSIDNLQIFPTTPYLDLRAPLDGDVVLFDETLADGWALWGESAVPQVVGTDEELGQVIQFNTTGSVVAGMAPTAPVDVSAFVDGTVHFDLKMTAAPAATEDWKLKIEGTGAAGLELSIDTPTLDTWVHYSIALAQFGDLSQMDNFMIFPSYQENAGAEYSVDNITFSTEAPAVAEEPDPAPEVAAADPTALDANVISIFSDVYTDIADVNFNPAWSQTTVHTIEEVVAGNSVLKNANFNYQGIDFAGTPQDVSGLTSFHVDFWTDNAEDAGAISIKLVSNPGPSAVETEIVLTPNKGNWVSLDIPLTDFSPVDLTDVSQIVLVGTGIVYFDNLYFH